MTALATATLCAVGACVYQAATAYETYQATRLHKWGDRAVTWGLAALACFVAAVWLWGAQGP